MKTTDLKFIELCKKVSYLTTNNAHTEALQTIANFFVFKHYITIFFEIAAIEAAEIGYFSTEILEYRNRKSYEMRQLIKIKYGDDVYDEINNSLLKLKL